MKSSYWKNLKACFEKMFLHPRRLQVQDLSIESEISKSIEAINHQALVMLARSPFIKSENYVQAEKEFNDRSLVLQDAIKQGQRGLAELIDKKQKHEEQLDLAAAASRILHLSKFWCSQVEELVSLRANTRSQTGHKCEQHTALIVKAMGSLDIIADSNLLLTAEDRATLQNDRKKARAYIDADGSTGSGLSIDTGDADAFLPAGLASSTMNEPEIDLRSDDSSSTESPDGSLADFESGYIGPPEEEVPTEFMSE